MLNRPKRIGAFWSAPREMREVFSAGLLILAAHLVLGTAQANAQAFVEYPNHPATHGDHSIAPSTWDGGPTSVVVSFVGDGTLHDDGIGASQRTARNTLTFAPPYSNANPQNYDELITLSLYGERLPLLQQMSASGISTLTYAFADPVNVVLDLLVADLDQNDAVRIRAFTAGNQLLDMNSFSLADETDLSTFKNTGTDFSPIIAPDPFVLFAPNEISLDAVDEENYNRSLSVLRSPAGAAIERIEINFEGTRNSPNRESGRNASHIYVALATAAPEPGFTVGLVVGAVMFVGMSRLRRVVLN